MNKRGLGSELLTMQNIIFLIAVIAIIFLFVFMKDIACRGGFWPFSC